MKFRDKKLVIEWKRSSFKIDVKASKSLNISGIVEDWVFWVWNERKTAKEIEEQIVENKVHPWIIILKERSRCSYKYKGDSLLPVLNTDDSDCSIEITTLNPANNKNIVWWSIGIDLFAGKNISKVERKNMKVITQLLFSDYPDTNFVSAHSYSKAIFSKSKPYYLKASGNHQY